MLSHKRSWKTVRPVAVDGDLAKITLSDGSLAIIDAQDLGLVAGWNWSGIKAKSGAVYAQRGDGRRAIRLHNIIMPPPRGLVVDHINGDSLDNRRANLRWATPAQNSRNRRASRSGKTSRFKGVSYRSDRNTWLAAIRVDGRLQKLGTFHTEELAARAYDTAAVMAFGEYALLNFSGAAA